MRSAANVAAWREFPDHHNYTREDVEAICSLARESGAKLIVCTRKDLVKLRVAAIGGIPLRAIGVELHFLRGEDVMTDALAADHRARQADSHRGIK